MICLDNISKGVADYMHLQQHPPAGRLMVVSTTSRLFAIFTITGGQALTPTISILREQAKLGSITTYLGFIILARDVGFVVNVSSEHHARNVSVYVQ
jgi:ferredoxin-NADP reductase